MAAKGFTLCVEEGEAVLPGDKVALVVQATDGNPPSVIRLGPGLRQDGTHVVSVRAGLVRTQTERSKLWLETTGRRYVPAPEDMVIGTVLDRHAEGYRLDIGAQEPAQLNSLSFEGATKKNRPYLEPGALVYARVTMADRDMEPEISCIQPGSNKSWISGESLFGELSGSGSLIRVSLSAARALLKPSCALLNALGESISQGFEFVVGMNGRVWIRASAPRDAIFVAAAIRMAEAGSLGPDPAKGVRTLLKSSAF